MVHSPVVQSNECSLDVLYSAWRIQAGVGGGGGVNPPSEVFRVYFCLSVYQSSRGLGP